MGRVNYSTSDVREIVSNLSSQAFGWSDRQSDESKKLSLKPLQFGRQFLPDAGIDISYGEHNLYCRYTTGSFLMLSRHLCKKL